MSDQEPQLPTPPPQSTRSKILIGCFGLGCGVAFVLLAIISATLNGIIGLGNIASGNQVHVQQGTDNSYLFLIGSLIGLIALIWLFRRKK